MFGPLSIWSMLVKGYSLSGNHQKWGLAQDTANFQSSSFRCKPGPNWANGHHLGAKDGQSRRRQSEGCRALFFFGGLGPFWTDPGRNGPIWARRGAIRAKKTHSRAKEDPQDDFPRSQDPSRGLRNPDVSKFPEFWCEWRPVLVLIGGGGGPVRSGANFVPFGPAWATRQAETGISGPKDGSLGSADPSGGMRKPNVLWLVPACR